MDFLSSASASAVCTHCKSTLLREGDVLRRIGLSAELFDDHSPLQLGAAGRHLGVAFTVVGRVQYQSSDSRWTEWHVLFDGADAAVPRTAWLSEDNGAHVMSFELPAPADTPGLTEMRAGERCLIDGVGWSVASVVRAKVCAAEGELPHPPHLASEFTVIDLRNERDEVGTLDDAGERGLHWSIGRQVRLEALKLRGLKQGPAAQTVQGHQLPCPNCGAPLVPTLASAKAITCEQCKSVVNLGGTPGESLSHYAQVNSGPDGLTPQIPLGRVGRLTLGPEGPQDWQVVGYMERCDVPVDPDDTREFWREYLLYNRSAGFAFLVDAQAGWSAVRPITGVPKRLGDDMMWAGERYRRQHSGTAKVTWVQGEFYWRVQQNERALVTDFAGPAGTLLSREQTGAEVLWSAGKTLTLDSVANAFRISGAERAAMRRDASPWSGLSTGGSAGGAHWLALFGPSKEFVGWVILLMLVSLVVTVAQCSQDDCQSVADVYGKGSAEYRQCHQNSGGHGSSGGSYGGYSSGGGGHK